MTARGRRRGIVGRVGRRAASQAVLGALWVLMGAYVASGADPIDLDDGFLHEYLPIGVRVALWAGTGAAALVAALYRWPPVVQDVGWWALLVLPLERAISCGWSIAHHYIPGPPDGAVGEASVMLAIWVLIAYLVLVVAGWDEDVPGVAPPNVHPNPSRVMDQSPPPLP